MTRHCSVLPAFALCAVLLYAGLALAAAPPPALEGADIEAAAALGGARNPASSAQQVSDLARQVEARENQASQSIEGMLNKAPGQSGSNLPPPGSPPRGGRKVIYGDIIIHK
ncbi:MAG: hypothetical protein AB9900_05755 [Humidesulfovibrio sp.]